jgi:hypothetical protein
MVEISSLSEYSRKADYIDDDYIDSDYIDSIDVTQCHFVIENS